MVTHLTDISCLSLDEGTGIVATGSSDKFIKIWDLWNRQQIKILEEKKARVNYLLFMQQGKILVSAAGNGKPESDLTFWEIKSGLILKQRSFQLKISSISMIKKETVIILCTLGQQLKLISTENLEIINTLVSNSMIKSVAITFSYILGVSDNAIKAWNIENFDPGLVVPIKITSYSLFSSYIDTIIWSVDSEILFYDTKNRIESGKVLFHSYRIVMLKGLGSKFVSASSDYLIVFWDFLSKSCYWKMIMNTVNFHAEIIFNRNAVVCADIFRSLKFVDESGSFDFSGHKFEITCWSLAWNQEFIATGSRDCSVRIWDFSSKTQLFVLNSHILTVSCVCFSQQNKFVVSGSFDCSIIIWDLQNQRANHAYTHHLDKIESLKPLKNTQKMIAVDEKGNISQLYLENNTYHSLQFNSNAPIKSFILTKNEKYCICSHNNLLIKLIKIV